MTNSHHLIALVIGVLLATAGHAQEPSALTLPDGETVFKQACFSCHGTGFYGAPVIGDEYAWEKRRIKGQQKLVANTIKGRNSMPPRGACVDCTDEEIAAAVAYLLSQ